MTFEIKVVRQELDAAVAALDRDRAGEIVEVICAELRDRPDPLDVGQIAKVLASLRRKRFFDLMQTVATQYLRVSGDSGRVAPVRVQLIQSLIDQGKLNIAQDEAEELIEATSIDEFDGTEARGLLGRIQKQSYVDGRPRSSGPRVRRLAGAVEAYLPVYLNAKQTNWWHGINAVACLARGERDGLDPRALDSTGFDWRVSAREILERTSGYADGHPDYTWAMATAMEAAVALEDAETASAFAERYINADYADVFELGSTERQLREVWQLDERDTPGSIVLAIIQGKLGQLGGDLRLSAVAEDPGAGTLRLEAQLGHESTVAVHWLEQALSRARAVAKVSKRTDDSVGGTGFLVDAKDLSPRLESGVALLTNAHVVSEGGREAMRPDQAVVHLTRDGLEMRIAKVLWTNHVLDASVCQLEPSPNVHGLPLGRARDLDLDSRGDLPRLYVMGHPHGAALQISLYDNRLIDRDDTHVRYRSTTHPGSSGSPVLSRDLEVIALHYATRIDQVANQGILLDAIRANLSTP